MAKQRKLTSGALSGRSDRRSNDRVSGADDHQLWIGDLRDFLWPLRRIGESTLEGFGVGE